jgi:hypothetical protein
MDDIVRKYFQCWCNMISYCRYDRWCEENNLQNQEEKNYCENYTKFIGRFHTM